MYTLSTEFMPPKATKYTKGKEGSKETNKGHHHALR